MMAVDFTTILCELKSLQHTRIYTPSDTFPYMVACKSMFLQGSLSLARKGLWYNVQAAIFFSSVNSLFGY